MSMFFNKKNKKQKCNFCNSRINKKFSFCPHCGTQLLDREKEVKDYGLLGKNDDLDDLEKKMVSSGGGITDKIVGSIVNNLFKSLNKQFEDIGKISKEDIQRMNSNTEVTPLPNGFKIKIGGNAIPKAKAKNKPKKNRKLIPDAEQIERMSKLPRQPAKSSVKRLSNKVVYELKTPGVQSIKDVFVSELESGYEIKAISPKKVYTSTIPLSLPLRSISLAKNMLLIEFLPGHQ